MGQKVISVTDNKKFLSGINVINVHAEKLPSGFYIIKMVTSFGELKTQIIKTK